MIFSINKTTHYILTLFQQAQQGIVHSVYRKTINLSFNGQLVAIQACHSPLSPISLITELSTAQMQELDISVGNKVIVSKNKIIILGNSEHYAFKHSTATIYDTKFCPEVDKGTLPFLTSSIHSVIADVDTNGMDLIFSDKLTDASPLPFIVANQRIVDAKELFDQGNYEGSVKELIRLIGLGSGLTPSGDDFLCGMLAGSQILNNQNHPFIVLLKEHIGQHLQDTVDVSAAFLSCALQNHFSLAVNSLGQNPSYEDMKENFLAIGHSSGIDTLCGVYFILTLFK